MASWAANARTAALCAVILAAAAAGSARPHDPVQAAGVVNAAGEATTSLGADTIVASLGQHARKQVKGAKKRLQAGRGSSANVIDGAPARPPQRIVAAAAHPRAAVENAPQDGAWPSGDAAAAAPAAPAAAVMPTRTADGYLLIAVPVTATTVTAAICILALAGFGCLYIHRLWYQHACACPLCRGAYTISEKIGSGGFGSVYVVKRRLGRATAAISRLRRTGALFASWVHFAIRRQHPQHEAAAVVPPPPPPPQIERREPPADGQLQGVPKPLLLQPPDAAHGGGAAAAAGGDDDDDDHGAPALVAAAAAGSSSEYFVLKMVSVTDINDATEAQREARDLQTLKHARIVRYVDDFLHATPQGPTREGALFVCIVMERCKYDLRRYIQKMRRHKARISEGLIVKWAAQIISALRYCHGRNVAHRDIKSQNIFLVGVQGGAGGATSAAATAAAARAAAAEEDGEGTFTVKATAAPPDPPLAFAFGNPAAGAAAAAGGLRRDRMSSTGSDLQLPPGAGDAPDAAHGDHQLVEASGVGAGTGQSPLCDDVPPSTPLVATGQALVPPVPRLPSAPAAHAQTQAAQLQHQQAASWDDVKIGDFGLAVRFERAVSTFTDAGTDCYKAPEMLTGVRRDARKADIFALGLVLLELVTQKFTWERPGSLGAKLLQDPGAVEKVMAEVPPAFSPALRLLVRKCLTADPAARPTAEELFRFKFLRRALGSSAGSTAPLATSSASVPSAASAVAGGAGAGFFAAGGAAAASAVPLGAGQQPLQGATHRYRAGSGAGGHSYQPPIAHKATTTAGTNAAPGTVAAAAAAAPTRGAGTAGTTAAPAVAVPSAPITAPQSSSSTMLVASSGSSATGVSVGADKHLGSEATEVDASVKPLQAAAATASARVPLLAPVARLAAAAASAAVASSPPAASVATFASPFMSPPPFASPLRQASDDGGAADLEPSDAEPENQANGGGVGHAAEAAGGSWQRVVPRRRAGVRKRKHGSRAARPGDGLFTDDE